MADKEMLVERSKATANNLASFGMISWDGVPFAVTLEPPPQPDSRGIACFPAGRYWCERVNTPTYGNTFEITGIAGHDAVLFHWGNWVRNTKMCVLIGENFVVMKGEAAIGASKNDPNGGFNEFLRLTEGLKGFWLEVR